MPENARETRIQIMLGDDELSAIDDWRFKYRMPSRAAAIRQLIGIGLQAADVHDADPSKRSQDFGILSKTDGEDEDSERNEAE